MWEALREAVDEEMEADPNVCVMGEASPGGDAGPELTSLPAGGDPAGAGVRLPDCAFPESQQDVGHYGGSYKVTYDLYKKYGSLRVLDTPICENAFLVRSKRDQPLARGVRCLTARPFSLLAGYGRRRRDDRAAADRRGHEHGLPADGLQPDLEQLRHDALHLGRAVQGADGHPGTRRCRPPAGRRAFPAPRVVLPVHPGCPAGRMLNGRQRKGAPEPASHSGHKHTSPTGVLGAHPKRSQFRARTPESRKTPGRSADGSQNHPPSCSCVPQALLKSAIRSDNPIIFFEHVLLYNVKGETIDGYYQSLERAEIARPGSHVTILTYSRMRYTSLQAAEKLAQKGIDCEVIDLISLKPFDMETISNSVKKTRK